VTFSTTDSPAAPAAYPDGERLADSIEQRVLDRLEQWKRDELDEHVLQLVERRLQEETERRSWRRGTEVF